MSSSSILPPSVGAILPGRTDGAAVTLSASGAAPVLDLLVDGAVVDVVLMGRPGKASLQVMTSRGPLDLKAQGGSLLPLADGANLTLKVMQTAGGPQMRLLAVNGRALPGVVLPNAAGPDGLAVGRGGTAAGASLPGGGGGAVLNAATVASPSGNSMPLGLTAVMVRPALVSVAGGANAGMAQSALPQHGQPEGPPVLADLPPNLPTGTRLLVRVVETLPPAAQGEEWMPPPSLPPSHGSTNSGVGGEWLPQLGGTVVAKPPQGRAMIQTAIGTLSLPVQDSVQVGDRLRLEVVQKPAAPPPSPPPDPLPRGLGAHGWAALTETLNQLPGEALAKEAAPFLRLLPQMGPHLLTGMVMFVDALNREERRRDAVGSLERALEKKGRRDLAQKVGEDLEQIASDSRPTRNEADWRLLLIPLVSQQVVEPVRLYVRGVGGEGGENGAESQRHEQRFVLDFTLSRMGRLQLDGLVRQGDKQFDLIIRTQEPLPAWTRHDLHGLFQDAAELFGTAGSIAFQAGGGWVEPGQTQPHSPTQIMA